MAVSIVFDNGMEIILDHSTSKTIHEGIGSKEYMLCNREGALINLNKVLWIKDVKK